MTGVLLALDPGFTATGYALFRDPPPEPYRVFVGDLLRWQGRLVCSGSWKPPQPASVGFEPRAAWLVEQAASLVAERGAMPYLGAREDVHHLTVAVEVHAIAAQYRRHSARDRGGKGKMNAESVAMNRELCGWLAGSLVAPWSTIVRVPASAAGKRKRTADVYLLWPELKNGKSNEHQRDAIALGLRVLLDGRRKARVAAAVRQARA